MGTGVVQFLTSNEHLVSILILFFFLNGTFCPILRSIFWIFKTFGFGHFCKEFKVSLVKDYV